MRAGNPSFPVLVCSVHRVLLLLRLLSSFAIAGIARASRIAHNCFMYTYLRWFSMAEVRRRGGCDRAGAKDGRV